MPIRTPGYGQQPYPRRSVRPAVRATDLYAGSVRGRRLPGSWLRQHAVTSRASSSGDSTSTVSQHAHRWPRAPAEQTDGRGRRDTDGRGRRADMTGGQPPIGYGGDYGGGGYGDDSYEPDEKPRKRRTGLVFLLTHRDARRRRHRWLLRLRQGRATCSARRTTPAPATRRPSTSRSTRATTPPTWPRRCSRPTWSRAPRRSSTRPPPTRPGPRRSSPASTSCTSIRARRPRWQRWSRWTPTAIRRTPASGRSTIPEGELSFDIFADLAKVTGLPVKQFNDAAKDPVALGVNPAWFTAKRDDGRKSMKSIEGFLFPATYSFAPGTSRRPTCSRRW